MFSCDCQTDWLHPPASNELFGKRDADGGNVDGVVLHVCDVTGCGTEFREEDRLVRHIHSSLNFLSETNVLFSFHFHRYQSEHEPWETRLMIHLIDVPAQTVNGTISKAPTKTDDVTNVQSLEPFLVKLLSHQTLTLFLYWLIVDDSRSSLFLTSEAVTSR